MAENDPAHVNAAKLKRLFPFLPKNHLYSKLKIDKDSLRYITPPYFSKQIVTIIKKHLAEVNIPFEEAVITDATAGVGGDTIAFAKTFRYVYSFELNKIRCEYLRNNVDVYRLKNVKISNKSFLKGVPLIKNHDVLFIDPPWETEETYGKYRLQSSIRIRVDNKPLENICAKFFSYKEMENIPEFIVLKLPLNYDMDYFYSILKKNRDLEITPYNLVNNKGEEKIKIVVLRKLECIQKRCAYLNLDCKRCTKLSLCDEQLCGQHLALKYTEENETYPRFFYKNPTEIVRYLFLGSEKMACNRVWLNEHNIRVVINTTDEFMCNYGSDTDYHIWYLRDVKTENIKPYLEKTAVIIDEALRKKEGILIHSHMGISRSATLVWYWLATRIYDGDAESALAFLEYKRWIVKPNSGFKKQIREVVVEKM